MEEPTERIEIVPNGHLGKHFDGQFYHFSTVQIMDAATKKWGEKSRRVKELYRLLAEMIHEEDKKA